MATKFSHSATWFSFKSIISLKPVETKKKYLGYEESTHPQHSLQRREENKSKRSISLLSIAYWPTSHPIPCYELQCPYLKSSGYLIPLREFSVPNTLPLPTQRLSTWVRYFCQPFGIPQTEILIFDTFKLS